MKKTLLIAYNERKHYIPLDLGYVKAYCDNSPEIRLISRKDNIFICGRRLADYDYVFFFLDHIIHSDYFPLRYALRLFSIIRRYNGKTKLCIQSHKIDEDHSKRILLENKQVNCIVRGEPEITISKILEGRELINIDGLSYRDTKINVNPDRELLDDLDVIPSPYVSGALDKGFYLNSKTGMVLTSRGCIFDCYYCFRSNKYKRIRYFSIERIVEELKCLRDNGVQRVRFVDDCFISNQKRFENLVEAITKENLGLRFQLMCRVEFLTKMNINLLKKLDTYDVQIGLQTVNKENLIRLHRKFDPESFGLVILYHEKSACFDKQGSSNEHHMRIL